jgi:type IV pilus assembly protein PilW
MNAHSLQPRPRMRRSQQGFTLVELSIAVLIGLFLLGGLLTLVQDMRRTFGAQNQLGQLQDSERLAMTLIADVVQAAGYYPDPTIEIPTVIFPAVAPFTQDGPGQSIAGIPNAAAPGDSISIQYLTANNDGVINCTGGTNTTGANQIYVNTFRVVANATQDLQCTLNGAAPVTLVSGVTNMQILYGVRANIASLYSNNVDTYMTTAQVIAGNDWANIICVKVTLTFTNPLAATQPGQPATIPFTRVVTVMNRAGVNTT